MSKLILITNPGSASRKYALYDGRQLVANFHFEYEGKKVVCTLKDSEGNKSKLKINGLNDLNECATEIARVLREEQYINDKNKLVAILVRIVAPGDYFVKDRIVDEEFMKNLAIAEERNPVHVPNTANEIKHLREAFADTELIAISDSAFHWSKPDTMKYYSFDMDLADKYEIKRYGYHGLSYGFISRYMKENEILPEKLVVLHLGSGTSAAAILNGNAMDNTMGYTPLEGTTMSTRAGSMDVTAALALKKALKIETDEELQFYLNKKCGLLGVSGKTDDMRDIMQARNEGDLKATMAYSLFIYRIQAAIGQMAAALGGIDALVFAGTIGERSEEIRHSVVQKLDYLGLRLDSDKNLNPEFTGVHAKVSSNDSKPIYIVQTDESDQMIDRAFEILDKDAE